MDSHLESSCVTAILNHFHTNCDERCHYLDKTKSNMLVYNEETGRGHLSEQVYAKESLLSSKYDKFTHQLVCVYCA